MVALTLLSYVKPLEKPVTFVLSVHDMGVKLAHTYTLLSDNKWSKSDMGWSMANAAFSTACVAALLLGHRYMSMIGTARLLCSTLGGAKQDWLKGNVHAAGNQLLRSMGYTCLLGATYYASLPMLIAGTTLTLLFRYSALAERLNAAEEDGLCYLEAACQLVQLCFTRKDLREQRQALQFARQVEQLRERLWRPRPTHHPVGILGEKWPFFSDHLPIGARVGDTPIFSFNVLDNRYISWVTQQDSQGLNGSKITELNVASATHPLLTERDVQVVRFVAGLTEKESCLIALQECSPPVLLTLSAALPANQYGVLSDGGGNVLFYPQAKFTYLPEESALGNRTVFSDHRPVLDVVLRDNLSCDRIALCNAHLPGDPTGSAPDDFARHVVHTVTQGGIPLSIGLGDMNFTPDIMDTAFKNALHDPSRDLTQQPQVLPLYPPYYTNVGVDLGHSAKTIDGIFVVAKPSQSPLLDRVEIREAAYFGPLVEEAATLLGH
jgi:hypothetical protein